MSESPSLRLHTPEGLESKSKIDSEPQQGTQEGEEVNQSVSSSGDCSTPLRTLRGFGGHGRSGEGSTEKH